MMEQKRGYLGLTAWSEIVTIVCFLLVLVVPGVTMLIFPQHVRREGSEQWPIRTVIDRYARFKDGFQKRFGFRIALVDLHARMKMNWIGVSPSHRVLIGKDGWWFYSDDNEVLCSRHSQFTPGQLAHWAAVLEGRQEFLAKRGIHYLFVIAPDKHTIYPEYLPRVMAPVKRQSRLDQLIDYVGKHTKVRILDLRPAIIAAKPLGRLYFLRDGHWTPLGAFIAYQQILARVHTWYPDVKPHQLSDYSFEDSQYDTNLASFVGLQSMLTEHLKTLEPRFRSKTRVLSGQLADDPRIQIDVKRSVNPDAPIPKLLMFRDSFASKPLPYIAEHFRNAVFLFQAFDTGVVEKEKPDVVMDEFVELKLMHSTPKQ